MILNAIGGRLLLVLEPDKTLLLGDAFAQRSRQVFDSLEKRRRRLVGHLSKLPLSVIRDEFASTGDPVSAEQMAWFNAEYRAFEAFKRRLSFWDVVPFDEEQGLGNF